MSDKEDEHQDDEAIVIEETEEGKEEPQENHETKAEGASPLPDKHKKSKSIFLIIGILIINAADNFLMKSILKSSDYYEPYFAKAVIQGEKHNVEGMKYYLKLTKGKLHYDTNIKLSYNIELR